MIVYLLLSAFVSCGRLPTITNGFYTVEGSSAGSISWLFCVSQYTVVGSPRYYCGRNGEWQGVGTCRKFVLLFIFSIQISMLTITKSFKIYFEL